MMKTILLIALLVVAMVGYAYADTPQPELRYKQGSFQPETLNVPSGQKFSLTINNEDDQAFEFESYDLNREKIVPPKSKVTVYIGPLDPGSYTFFNDFNRAKIGKFLAQ